MAVCELLCRGQEMVMAYWCLTLFFPIFPIFRWIRSEFGEAAMVELKNGAFVVDFAGWTFGRGSRAGNQFTLTLSIRDPIDPMR